ncbi:MAG: (Fe-S)-binding protein [Chloroflexi bacterium]|nr:MAG: (Fe-S)-binding protein [Chloroflexota bacterium]
MQQNKPPTPVRLYHVEPTSPRKNRVDDFLTAFAAILRHSNYRFLLDLYARTSTKCGRCAVACQVYQASGDPRDVPCYRTNLLLDIYRRHFTPTGWLQSRFSGSRPLTEETIDEMAELFYRCTACRRCKIECPLGIDHGLMARLGRYILSEIGIAPKGLVVSVREQLEGKTGNTSAIPLVALIDNLEFLAEEIEEDKGVAVQFPVDQQNAEYIFFPAVSDYLMEADTLMGNAAVLHAANISWTIGSQYFDGINYGLFFNDWILERIIKKMIAEARRLNAEKILVGECGHAARTAKQFISTFGGKDAPPVVSVLEVTAQAIQQGKIQLDPDAIQERVTYHDPCNIARSGWLVKQPRQILRSFIKNFVEMQPNGTANYCCGGGGGLAALDETHDFRMQVVGKTKAEQVRATGADIIATPCANCKKQLREIADYYKLPVQVVGVHDLVFRAIKL